ncbi:MAG: hypothetical protein EXS36_19015 [Pedosphaera sp.]|nr:hypothetical protein [Pedosphaera sp.]
MTNYTWVAISPDGQALALGQPDGGIQIRNLSTGQTLRTLSGDGSRVRQALFSTSNDLLAVQSGSYAAGSIRIWSVTTGKEIQVFRDTQSDRGERSRFVFSPDGKELVFVGSDSRVMIARLRGAVRIVIDPLVDPTGSYARRGYRVRQCRVGATLSESHLRGCTRGNSLERFRARGWHL